MGLPRFAFCATACGHRGRNGNGGTMGKTEPDEKEQYKPASARPAAVAPRSKKRAAAKKKLKKKESAFKKLRRAVGDKVIAESDLIAAALIGGCFYEEWQKAAGTGVVKHFFPWWMERRYRARAPNPIIDPASLTDEERDLAARHGLDREQIAWRRQIRADFRGLARQEFAEDEESCFLSSGESVFELAAVEARLASAPAPVELRRNGEMEIWLPPLAGKRYLVAVDPAGGGSEGDSSAAQVIELAQGLQCAEFAGHVGGLELARLVTALAAEYNQAWLVVERNNHGSGVLALAESVCKYPRIFYAGGQPGWLTTSLSRPAILALLNAALIETPRCFQSRRLLAECRSFIRQRDGKTGARPGTHDDRVMAMATVNEVRAMRGLAPLEGNEGQRDQGTRESGGSS